MSFFERFKFGAQSTPAVTASAAEFQETRYRGASRVLRSMAAWWARVGSPTSDLPVAEQRTLRARSRDAFRNHMVARAALTRCRTNIIGTGLVFRPAVDFKTLGIEQEAADEINSQIAAGFARWAENPSECDYEATSDFYGLQGLALISAMSSGDVFALTPDKMRNGGISGLKIQLIEADRISNPFDGIDSPALIDGIVIDDGAPVGCWIRNTHPGDVLAFSVVYPMWTFYQFFGADTGRRRVLHVWNDKERPGQVRGAPYLAPILEPLRQLARYGDAELMAAVISSMLTVFIEHETQEVDELGNQITTFTPEDGKPSLALGNGAVVDLAPGEKATSVNPSRPNANFDPFFVSVVKQIGAALELPVDELLLSYQASYSAARAAMLQAWRFYALRRWAQVQQFSQPVFNLWLDEEVASGRINLPGYGDPIKRCAYTRGMWIGPARGSMDEQKEAAAAKTRIDIGVSNETIETAAMTGEDWGTVYPQRVREINQRKKDGTWTAQPTETVRVSPPTDPNADPTAPTDPTQPGADPAADPSADPSADPATDKPDNAK